METYLSIIESNLGYSATHIATAAIAIGLLICLLAVMGSRRKAMGQIAALEKAQAAHEQAQVQLSENLQATQEQLQNLENGLTAKNHHIGQLEQEKQAAQHQAERAALLEGQISQHRHKLAEVLDTLAKEFTLEAAVYDSADAEQEDLLWQRHSLALAQLAQRLQTEEQHRKTLELAQQTAQTQLTEKGAALDELKQALDNQAAQIANLKQDFTEQNALMQTQLDNSQEELAKLQAKNRSNKATISKLETGRMQVFNDLNLALQKICQLEAVLANKATAVEPTKQEPLVQQHAASESIAPKQKPLSIQTEAPAEQPSGESSEPAPQASPAAKAPEPQQEASPAGQAQAEPPETAPQAAQLFGKLLGAIGLGKRQASEAPAPTENAAPEALQDTTEQPLGQNGETAPASLIPEQLKGFFKKATAFSKK